MSKDPTSVNAVSGQSQQMPQPNGHLGLPAITPHLALNAAGRNAMGLSGAAGLATYTAADATSYVISNPSTRYRPTTPVLSADVTVAFMTDAAADTLLNNHIGLASTAIVCVVQIHATFNISSLGAVIPPGKVHWHANYAYQVYDGVTGNLLMETGTLKPLLH
jgi:hypothetical protein